MSERERQMPESDEIIEREEFCEKLGLELLDTLEILGVEDADMSDGRALADTVYCLGYRLPAPPAEPNDLVLNPYPNGHTHPAFVGCSEAVPPCPKHINLPGQQPPTTDGTDR